MESGDKFGGHHLEENPDVNYVGVLHERSGDPLAIWVEGGNVRKLIHERQP
jgi:hypothetical protein